MQILHGRGATPILELLGIKHPRVEARSDVVYTAEEILMPFFHTHATTFIGMVPYGSADEARRLLFPVRKRAETNPCCHSVRMTELTRPIHIAPPSCIR
jgi:hypothetical protein